MYELEKVTGLSRPLLVGRSFSTRVRKEAGRRRAGSVSRSIWSGSFSKQPALAAPYCFVQCHSLLACSVCVIGCAGVVYSRLDSTVPWLIYMPPNARGAKKAQMHTGDHRQLHSSSGWQSAVAPGAVFFATTTSWWAADALLLLGGGGMVFRVSWHRRTMLGVPAMVTRLVVWLFLC